MSKFFIATLLILSAFSASASYDYDQPEVQSYDEPDVCQDVINQTRDLILAADSNLQYTGYEPTGETEYLEYNLYFGKNVKFELELVNDGVQVCGIHALQKILVP